MKLEYLRDEKVPAILDIDTGDTIQTSAKWMGGVRNVKVLAVVEEAIITESALNSAWSNRVYSAQEIYRMDCTVIKKDPTPKETT